MMRASFCSVLLFFWGVTGVAMASPVLLVDGSPNPPGDSYQALGDNVAVSEDAGTLFPRVKVGGVVRHKIRIRNIGSSILTYTVSDNSSQFRAISAGSFLVPTTGEREFEVEFKPTSIGLKSAVMTISSNDPNRPSFRINLSGRGTDSELDIFGGPQQDIEIEDGDDSPNLTDFTDFGSRDVSDGAVSKFFRLKNSGDADLLFINATITAGQGFSISSLPAPASFLGGEEQHSFIISFNPSSARTRIATVTVLTDDADEGSYTFDVRGTGTTTPDIGVSGRSDTGLEGPIFDGASSALSINGTKFENTSVGDFTQHSFWVENEGTGNLDYRITSSNSEFDLAGYLSANIASGEENRLIFTIYFRPTGPEPQTSTIRIESNDPDEDPFTFVVEGTGIEPEITVLGDVDFSEEIESGDKDPRVGDGTDMLDFVIDGQFDGSFSSRKFRIRNDGLENLTFISAAITSQEDGFFLLNLPPGSTPIPPRGFVEFDIGFDPPRDGQKTAAVSILTNDADESIYTFEVTANGVGTPNIGVSVSNEGSQSSGGPIAAGTLVPSIELGTQFGEVDLGESRSRMFSVRNSGNGTLDYTATVSGSHFSIVELGASLDPEFPGGAKDDFFIVFEPTTRGVKSAIVTVTSNDPDTPSFVFIVEGQGTDAEIGIFGGENLNRPVVDGAISSNSDDGTTFGPGVVNSAGQMSTFLIFNSGERDLVLVNGSVSNSDDFSISGLPGLLDPVAPNTSVQFQVTFEPQSAGRKSTTLTIISNDSDENPYTFVLNGIGANGPEFELLGGDPLVGISDGDDTPVEIDGSEFGPVEVGALMEHEFTIRNEGNKDLVLTEASISLGQGFVLGALPLAVRDGDETTFTITFSPTTEGVKWATVTIPNNDADEGSYTFMVRGSGFLVGSPPAAEVTGESGVIIPSGSLTPTVEAGTDFGSVTQGGILSGSFTFRNTGGADLTVTSQVGAPMTLILNPVGPGEEESFVVSLPTDTPGKKSAMIFIGSNDPNQALYSFVVEGVVIPEDPPEIESMVISGVNATFRYQTINGLSYQFYESSSLLGDSWSPVGIPLSGSGVVQNFTIASFVNQGLPRRFIRVEIVVP